MTLASAVVLTNDIHALADFYAVLLDTEPAWYRDDYCEVETGGARLALFTVAGHDAHIADGVAEAAANRSLKLEFAVDDVDATYARLTGADRAFDWVMAPPEDLPWGTRAVVLRDPDGHLLEIYAPRDA